MGKILEAQAARIGGTGVLSQREVIEGTVMGHGKRRETVRVGVTSKMSARVKDLQQSRLLPQELHISDTFVQNNRDGGSFIEVALPSEEPFYVKFRRLGLPAAERSKLYKNPVSQAELVTAMCVFGVGGTQVTMKDGTTASLTDSHAHITQPITDLRINPHLSLYEMEAIYRTASWINTLRTGNENIYSHLTIASPRINYYFFGLEHAQEGRMSLDMLAQWMQAVDRRVDRLNMLLTDRINPGDTRKLAITIREPLAGIQSYITDCVHHGTLPELSRAIDFLRKDSVWERVLRHTSMPTSWIELGLLSESVEEIRPTLETAGLPTVVVKSQEEESTFVQSEKLLKSIAPDAALLVGMYPHQEIIVGEGRQETSLFRVQDSIPLSNARRVYRQFFP